VRLYVILATGAGLALLVLLLVCNDAPAIFATVANVGWGLLLVVAVRSAVLIVAGLAWAMLLQPLVSLRASAYLLLRWIRESINVLLPVAQIGGDLMGGRLLTFSGVSGGQAGASILVDLTVQLATQLAFTVIGFVLLAVTTPDARAIEVMAGGLAISAATVVAFYIFQRSGLIRIADALVSYGAKHWPRLSFGGLAILQERVQAIYGQRRAVLASFVLHLAAWFLGALEIWIVLIRVRLNSGMGECLVLESLGQAVRSADFAIPGVIGVQEGGFLVIGSLYGIRPEVCLALSLVKRIPDLALGVPGLIAWLVLEIRHHPRARAALRGS
jgi:glycosyltransferase 2 family protein